MKFLCLSIAHDSVSLVKAGTGHVRNRLQMQHAEQAIDRVEVRQ